MRVYISGKIGEAVISDATRQKFAKAEEMLEAKGYEVFNPTDGEWQEHLRKRYPIDREQGHDGEDIDFYAYALLRDMMVLATCEAIYMLPDFLDSKGAKAEHAFAVATGKKVYYADELFANGTLRREYNSRGVLPEAAP